MSSLTKISYMLRLPDSPGDSQNLVKSPVRENISPGFLSESAFFIQNIGLFLCLSTVIFDRRIWYITSFSSTSYARRNTFLCMESDVLIHSQAHSKSEYPVFCLFLTCKLLSIKCRNVCHILQIKYTINPKMHHTGGGG